MMRRVRRSPAELVQALRLWLSRLPDDWPPADPATTAFCRQRLHALADESRLSDKLIADLGTSPWRPLGHVLAIVSENDHLGCVAAMVAAALTGNRLTLKARAGVSALLALRDALDWDAATCRIADWDSADQDDSVWLAGIDGVVMAGGDSLIRHYRRVAETHVRLIEYGPQMSAAYISTWPSCGAEQVACIDALVRDTTLFLQSVCSSPQFVLVPDEATGAALFSALTDRLDSLPPLADEIRFQQTVRAQELRLLARGDEALGRTLEVALDARTGWAATRSPASPSYWMPRGFRVVVGRAGELPATTPPLQTVGIWPPASAVASEVPALHLCRLGRMHERPLCAPHDGHRELAEWVRFVSSDL